MLHEQQQTISMRSSFGEWTYVLLMNTPCSHLHILCASGLSNGPATNFDSSVTMEGGRESITQGGPAYDFIFVPQYVIVVGLRFKWYTLYT
jgi:hypothetical protein